MNGDGVFFHEKPAGAKSYTSHGLPTLWRGSCEWWSNQLYQMAPYTLSDTLDRKISSRFTHPQSPRPGKDRQNPESFRVGKTRFWKKGPTVCINKRTLTIVEGKRSKAAHRPQAAPTKRFPFFALASFFCCEFPSCALKGLVKCAVALAVLPQVRSRSA